MFSISNIFNKKPLEDKNQTKGFIKDKITEVKSKVLSIIKTVGSIGIAGIIATTGIPLKGHSEKIIEPKNLKNTTPQGQIYEPKIEIYKPKTKVSTTLENGGIVTIDLNAFKKVIDVGIGPIEFVQKAFWQKLEWEEIKGRLVSLEKGDILLDSRKLRLDYSYKFASSTEEAKEIGKTIKNQLQQKNELKQELKKKNEGTEKKTGEGKILKFHSSKSKIKSPGDIIKKQAKKSDYGSILNIKSFPAKKGAYLNLCSQTARQNLTKLVGKGMTVFRGDAKHIIKNLSKTNPILHHNDLAQAIVKSNNNVFDVYLKTRNGHRSVMFKSDGEIFVLDPYIAKTRKPVSLEKYTSFIKKGSKFLLGPSYSSNIVSGKLKFAFNESENTQEEILIASNDSLPETFEKEVNIVQNETQERVDAITMGDAKIGEVIYKIPVAKDEEYEKAKNKLGSNTEERAQTLKSEILEFGAKGDTKHALSLALYKFENDLKQCSSKSQVNNLFSQRTNVLKENPKYKNVLNDNVISHFKLFQYRRYFELCENDINYLYKKGITGDLEAYKESKRLEPIKLNIAKNIIELENKLNITNTIQIAA